MEEITMENLPLVNAENEPFHSQADAVFAAVGNREASRPSTGALKRIRQFMHDHTQPRRSYERFKDLALSAINEGITELNRADVQHRADVAKIYTLQTSTSEARASLLDSQSKARELAGELRTALSSMVTNVHKAKAVHVAKANLTLATALMTFYKRICSLSVHENKRVADLMYNPHDTALETGSKKERTTVNGWVRDLNDAFADGVGQVAGLANDDTFQMLQTCHAKVNKDFKPYKKKE